MLVESI